MIRSFIIIGLGLAIQSQLCHTFSTTNYVHLPNNNQRHSSSSLQSQVLDFIEPTTGVPVKLVGAMHYNPASIQLAVDTINELEKEDKLGSIIIESCDKRWNATLDSELVKKALQSEMKAAHDLGIEYGVPVVLGDQDINITVSELKNGAKEAVLDLIQPWNGGWERLLKSISSARKEAVPLGEEYLGAGAFFDPKLLGSSPVSFIKYPLSYLVKSPAYVFAIGALILLSGSDADATTLDELSTSDLLESLLFSALETVIFARIFLKELLADRNVVLAENILQQCRNYEKKRSSGWFDNLFQEESDDDLASGAIYAPDSVVGRQEEGKVVVAVLGLAHLNGIKKLLTEKS